MNPPAVPAAAHHHAPPQGFLRRHVFSLDHKVIGKQYLDLALVAVCIGMGLSWLMRLHLAWPNLPIPGLEKLSPNGAANGVITPEYYLSLMTMHATIMVFFVLTSAPFAGFGNYFLPIQVGAEDMAFPRFNMMSFWTTCVAFLVLVSSFFVSDGPALSGWTAYAPLSAVGKDAGLDRNLLYRLGSQLDQLHRDLHRPALHGYVAAAPAPNLLGLVYYCDLEFVELFRLAGCCGVAFS